MKQLITFAAIMVFTCSVAAQTVITLHDPALNHALKEVDEAAQATCEQPGQVVDILRYVLSQG